MLWTEIGIVYENFFKYIEIYNYSQILKGYLFL
jgi:hypothetical protein